MIAGRYASCLFLEAGFSEAVVAAYFRL